MEKKQSSVEQVFSHIKASRNHIQYWNDSMLVDWLLEQEDRLKAMQKEEIISFAKKCLDKALDLDVRTAHSQVEEMYNETFGGKSFQSSGTSNQIDRTITATNGGSNE